MNQKLLLKKDPLLLLLQIYIFCLMAWDYEIFYQVPLVVLTIVTFIKYKKIGRVIKNSTFFHKYLVLMVYYLAQYMVGHTVSPDDSRAYLIIGFVNLMAIMCFATAVRKKEHLSSVFKTIVVGALIISFYNIFMNGAGVFSGTLSWNCFKLFFSYHSYSHSTVPTYCAFAVMIIIHFGMTERFTGKRIALIVYFSAYVVLSASRNALIFLIFGLIIYPFLFTGKREQLEKRAVKLIVAFALLMLVLWAILNIPSLYNAIGSRVEDVIHGMFIGYYTESSASSRNVMLTTGISLIKKNWLFGYGLNTFRTFPGSFGTWSHNQYIESMVSGGLIGLIIFLSFNISSLFALRKKVDTRLGGFCICLMIYMLACNMFNVVYMDRFVCIIYGVVDSYLMIEKSERKAGRVLNEKTKVQSNRFYTNLQ